MTDQFFLQLLNNCILAVELVEAICTSIVCYCSYGSLEVNEKDGTLGSS